MSLTARQAETAERLLVAGLEELRLVGHEDLTVRNVAQRAGVSPATAYTYLTSKNHLLAELFWRFLTEDGGHISEGGTPLERVRSVTGRLAQRLSDSPELAAAVTPALLSSDPAVERLRLRIGAEFLDRFRAALGDDAEPAVVEAIGFAFSGALLQAGMGLLTYLEMGERLNSVVAVIVARR